VNCFGLQRGTTLASLALIQNVSMRPLGGKGRGRKEEGRKKHAKPREKGRGGGQDVFLVTEFSKRACRQRGGVSGVTGEARESMD